jgi:MFS transporter, DHA2 family, multidrug resistance protein
MSTPVDRSAPSNRWAVLAVMCAAVGIVVIDMTVLHIATPAISEDLHPSTVQLLWIVDIYPLVVAPLLVASGTLGDRLGRKRILVAGLVVFCLASVLAGLAWSAGVLIFARAVQGVGGAMILPSTMSIVRDVFPDRQERVRAVGIWSAVMAGGAAVGPLVGGALIERFSWGAVFLINVPLLLVLLPFALRILPESRSSDPPPWDTLAVVLVGGGVLGLAYGIKEGAHRGFLDPIAVVSLLVSTVLLVTFVRRMLGRDRPLLDLRLFARPAFSVAVGCVLLAMFALVGLEYFFAQYLQLVLGLDPLAASVRLIPLMVATFAGALSAARLLGHVGTRGAVAGGLGATALSLVPLLWLGTAEDYLLLWPTFIVLGFAVEVAMVAANDTIFSSVSADAAGGAASIEETAYELGGGLGVAVLGSIGAAVYLANLPAIEGAGHGTMAAARESLGGAVDAADALPARAATALVDAARSAFMDGFHVTILVAFVILAASALLAAFILRRSDSEPLP